MWVSTLAFLFVYSLLVPIGIYSRNIFPEGIADTDRIVTALLNKGNIPPPVLAAFLLVALDPPGGIVTLTAFSGSLYAACFFPAILLGLHWSRGNGTSVIASFVLGSGTLLLWDYLPFAAGIHEVFPALLLSSLAYLIVPWCSSAHGAKEVQQLFSNSPEG
jgi:Na+(H+)/acetate symporter ActP